MRFFLLLFFVMGSLIGSSWTDWTEFPGDPIFNPFPETDGEDYWPHVIYDADKFSGNGASFFYKMWHQGSNPNGALAVSYSNDGVNWFGTTDVDPLKPAFHAVVLYDKNGFGVGGKPYRIWYWDGTASTTNVGVIHFSQSNDGITWDLPVPITQDPGSPLLDNGTFFFFQLYGPGFVIYNPNATSTPGQPYTFPFVMYYDIATSVQQTQAESIALAYSNDGIAWTRFGTQPVLIPSGNVGTDWDATHLFRPSVFKFQGVYHMFYSGSNQFQQPLNPFFYAHGLGHASSVDGINWVKDVDNPIFINTDGVPWRDTRTYTPFVLYFPFCSQGACPTCFAKMWFTGGTGGTAGQNQGIGYATLPCMSTQPMPPTNFVGRVFKNIFLNRSECVLEARWTASPSSDVAFYRIYRGAKLVAEIPATAPLLFRSFSAECDFTGFSIVAVNTQGIESVHVPLQENHN